MSREDEKCFQCEELGHMACHYPHIQCFDCDEYGHIAADAQTKYHHQVHWPATRSITLYTRHHTRSTSGHHHRDRHMFSRSRSQSHTHKILKPQLHHTHRGHSRSYHRHITEAHQFIDIKYLSLPMQHTTQKVIITWKFLHSFQRLQQI